MSTSLSVKYRPLKFADLVNQDHIKITLQNQLETNKVGHAYIFCGPRGLGKTTVARLIARAVNCEKREKDQSEPCGKCDSCQEISDNRSLDLIEIDAASNTGVDNVRENIIASARVSPSRRKYKVFIIDEVHMLSISAFNALLKTLEEPPTHVIFILATTEIHKVPETIISRCQRFDCRRVGAEDIIKRLKYLLKQEGKEVEDKILLNIARHAEGSIRDAESTLAKVLALGGKKIKSEHAEIILPRSNYNLSLDFLLLLGDKKTSEAITHVNMLVEEGIDLLQFCEDTIELARKALLLKINDHLNKFAVELDQEIEKGLREVVLLFNLKQITFVINHLIEARNELRTAQIPQLPLEIAVIEICEVKDTVVSNQDLLVKSVDAEEKMVNDDQVVNSEKPKKMIRFLKKKESDSVKNTLDQIDEKIKPSPELSEIAAKWQEIVNQLKSYNHSLSFVLKVCQPIEVKKDKLKLGVKYKLHQERLNQKNIRRIIEEVVGKIMNRKMRIEAVMFEEKPDGLIKNILNVFGGRVVE